LFNVSFATSRLMKSSETIVMPFNPPSLSFERLLVAPTRAGQRMRLARL
jgi:hypothetical protein